MARIEIFLFSNLFSPLLLVFLISSQPNLIECKSEVKIPDYIQRCKKNDPHLEQCILKAVEAFRPRFSVGMPELGIPPVDPLILPQVVIFSGENGGIKAIVNNVTVTGVKNIKFLALKVNLEDLEFRSSIFLPHIHFEGFYDVNAKFTSIRVKGQGPFRGNASDIKADSVIKGKLVIIEGIRYLEFISAQVHVTFRSSEIKVEKLFKDKQLDEAFNQLMNDRNVINMGLPLMDKFIAEMWLDTWNKVSKSISFDDMFAPDN